jgi:predicted alpha/beta-hydrolase family hydrolase
MLGHGAGGGVSTPDLTAAARAATAAGLTAALIEQPYRVAGKRSQPAAGQLDTAWLTVARKLLETEPAGRTLVVGGRSAGARVACRTAAELGADAVLCLAFPLHPPGKGDDPSKSRLGELDAVRVPVLVVQGERDPFGRPPPRRGNRRVVIVPGDHSLKSSGEVERAVAAWLGRCFGFTGVRPG